MDSLTNRAEILSHLFEKQSKNALCLGICLAMRYSLLWRCDVFSTQLSSYAAKKLSSGGVVFAALVWHGARNARSSLRVGWTGADNREDEKP